jgi:hypothetical protein
VDLSKWLFLYDDQQSTDDLRGFAVPPTQVVEEYQRKGLSMQQGCLPTEVLIPLMADSHSVHEMTLWWSMWRWVEAVQSAAVGLRSEDDARSFVVCYGLHNTVDPGDPCASPSQEATGFLLHRPTYGQK